MRVEEAEVAVGAPDGPSVDLLLGLYLGVIGVRLGKLLFAEFVVLLAGFGKGFDVHVKTFLLGAQSLVKL